MNLIPWRRRGSMLPLQSDLEDFFARFWGNGETPTLASHLPEVFRTPGFPAVNLAETEGSYTITLDCPGLDEKDIHVETMGNHLVVSGERKWEEEKKGKEFHRVESQYGKFERAIPLPESVRIEPNKIEATYKKGVLTIEVPKLEKTPAKKIPVHAG